MREVQEMKAGILERVLTRRYGQPVLSIMDGLGAKCWNPDEWDYASVLYIGMKWHGLSGTRFSSLRAIYGSSCGGYLIKNRLKAAILLPRKVYGIWNIDDLRMQQAVQHAVVMDPAIEYFMEDANVWFYGVKAGQLYVFDSVYDELDCLGPIESALENVFSKLVAIEEEMSEG
jgi:hypothetical protein